MTTLYRSARMVRRIVRAIAMLCLGEVTIHSMRESASEFGWRVTALTLLMLFVATYCAFTLMTTPVRRWGHP